MFTCECATEHEGPFDTVMIHDKHRAEAISKLGPDVVMTGASTSSHPKHDQAADPHKDYTYRTTTYWRPFNAEEKLAKAEVEKAAQNSQYLQAKQSGT